MHKLKPLQPDIHGTGRWGFRGQNLDKQDVANLSAKGIRWWEGENEQGELGDLMRDGRLKTTTFRSDFRKNARVNRNGRPRTRRAVMDDDTFEQEFAKWEKEWWALSQDERNEFGDFKIWFNKKYDFVLAKELLRNVLVSERVQQSTKAAATFMEFSQSKPKTVVENLQSQPENIDLDKVIEIALAMKGISLDKFRQFIESETNVPTQA